MGELERIRQEFVQRAHDPRRAELYSTFSRADLYFAQEREREIMAILAKHVGNTFSTMRVLDVGCGNGDQLAKFTVYGVPFRNLYGVDLLGQRLDRAKVRYPNLNWIQTDAGRMPLRNGFFDLLLQFTAFSSILDAQLRKQVAQEMLRVMTRDGAILWYDYRFNPTNPHTHGIERDELANLFPGCEFIVRRVTLAPPIARKIVRYSWILCALLSQIWFLRTHYLVLIQRTGSAQRQTL